jgi:hypothetical protein
MVRGPHLSITGGPVGGASLVHRVPGRPHPVESQFVRRNAERPLSSRTSDLSNLACGWASVWRRMLPPPVCFGDEKRR